MKNTEKKEEEHKTKSWAVCLVLACTLLTSIGQILLKLGSEKLSFDLSLLTNYNLIIGAILYAAAAGFLVVALKGGELSVLYPIIATSYIWVTLLSLFYLKESIHAFRWLGIVVIIIGISFIGKGGTKR